MLRNRVTGRKREVDVVISSETAGHSVTVAVEASSTKRPASVEWVERMRAKHEDLPTDKLVLVSEAGFREQARELAEAKGILVIAPEDVSEGDPSYTIVNRLRSIWPKTVSFTPDKARLVVRPPDEELTWFWAVSDQMIFFEDGTEVGTLISVIGQLIRANMPLITEQIGLRDIAEDTSSRFVCEVGPPWTVEYEGEQLHFFVKYEDVDPPEYHLIDRLVIEGAAEITVSEVSLAHRRLGDVMYSYGEGSVGGRDALLVFTEGEGGGQGTLRIRPVKE